MDTNIGTAKKLISDYKGKDYTFGIDCLDKLGSYVKEFGSSTLLIISSSRWAKDLRKKIINILKSNSIKIVKEVDTASPNTPVEDVINLAKVIKNLNPESITCVGGGSAIDCAKAANVLSSLCDREDEYEKFLDKFFGVGNVSKIAREKNRKLYPLIACQVVSGSGAHLTKYANVTNLNTGQKKLIIDLIIVPKRAVFDYLTTINMPKELTLDGAMDGLSHSLEVYFGADDSNLEKIEEVSLTAAALIIENLPRLINNFKDVKLREALGLATDLGGYAIMLKGASGPHLNSFSLVDILSHGRACAILLPYYTVFFAPAVEAKLKKLIPVYNNYIDNIDELEIEKLSPRALGETIAYAMINFSQKVGLPVKLSDVEGFKDSYIDKAINAAKDPQLESKLKNMPIPLTSDLVDEYMRPILEAARNGDFSLIKSP